MNDVEARKKVDMDDLFHVMSISRNDILSIAVGDEENPQYNKLKTVLENLNDDDMVEVVEGLCSVNYIFSYFYENVGISAQEMVDKADTITK